MKKLNFLLLLCLLLAACKDDDEAKQPIFVTNVSISDASKIFRPGEEVTITAEGFLEGDQLMLNARWPLPDEPIKEGYWRGKLAIITARTATSITFLAPGHLPASTVEIFLDRGKKYMSLGKISVADGQIPTEYQLYVISKPTPSQPGSIIHIDPATKKTTLVEELPEDQEFSLVVNSPGTGFLCGILKKGDSSSLASFDLSMNYWESFKTKYSPITTYTVGTGAIGAFTQSTNDGLTIEGIMLPSYTRNSRSSANPLFKLPEGTKLEALSLYPGVHVDGYLLFSADNGDGTFSPVVVKGGQMAKFDSIKTTALIPFWIPVYKDKEGMPADYYERVGGYIISGANGKETELRLWNTVTMSLEEPFATFPNPALSAATHFTGKTQELYVLFKATSNGNLIDIYDLQQKKWRSFQSGFPDAEIVLAR